MIVIFLAWKFIEALCVSALPPGKVRLSGGGKAGSFMGYFDGGRSAGRKR